MVGFISTMFALALGVLNSLLATYILRDVASTADLQFIMQYTFAQTFMAMAMVRIVTFHLSTGDIVMVEKLKEKFGEGYTLVMQIIYALAILLTWLMINITWHIIT